MNGAAKSSTVGLGSEGLMSLTSMPCPVFCSLANLIHVRSGKLGESNCPLSFDPGKDILQRHRIDAFSRKEGVT